MDRATARKCRVLRDLLDDAAEEAGVRLVLPLPTITEGAMRGIVACYENPALLAKGIGLTPAAVAGSCTAAMASTAKEPAKEADENTASAAQPPNWEGHWAGMALADLGHVLKAANFLQAEEVVASVCAFLAALVRATSMALQDKPRDLMQLVFATGATPSSGAPPEAGSVNTCAHAMRRPRTHQALETRQQPGHGHPYRGCPWFACSHLTRMVGRSTSVQPV